ncbi:MAG: NAD-dependent epimerase/dehydratase family protein [Bacteroidota bacterium]
MKNVLVLGGTGKTGRRIVDILQQKGHNVRIGSRGATPKFDWEDKATWSTALEGMDSVYITYQPDLAVPGAREAIEGLTK